MILTAGMKVFYVTSLERALRPGDFGIVEDNLGIQWVDGWYSNSGVILSLWLNIAAIDDCVYAHAKKMVNSPNLLKSGEWK